MNWLWRIAYGAALTGVALLVGRETIDASIYVYQELASDMVALGVAGWLIATSGPVALSIGVWRWARRFDPKWVLHLLFIPCAIALFRTGDFILIYATGVPDGDSIEGRTLIAATGFLALTLLVHAAALAALGVSRLMRPANVR
jgi:hypothetical protein